MKRIISLVFIGLVSAVAALGHEAFTLVSSEKLTLTAAQIADLQKQASVGKAEGVNLTFTGTDIKLVVVTGPEDDMLSYRIQGLRNPNIIAPIDSKFTVWFANVDTDMRHDIRFAHYVGEFVIAPDLKNSVGTDKLTAHQVEGTPFQAQKVVFTSNEEGSYKYFCSVRGHAKGGMWGNILVGVKPGANLKMPVKTEHAHSPGENKPTASPTPPSHEHKPTASPTPQDTSRMPAAVKNDDGKQHQDHSMPSTSPTPSAHDEHKPTASPAEHDMSQMPDMKKDEMTGMNHGEHTMASVTNIGDPMERESSGTAWAPDSTPVYAKMKMTEGGGMWMFMGTAFLRYTQIGGSRDVSVAGKGSKAKTDFPTMLMAMYSHPIGEKSQFGFRAMASLDPIFEQGFGYPLLYQSGEQFRGRPMHDRQHPHDVISELAVTFSHKFDGRKSFFLYAGIPGEPAYGPPMYLHRTSGMNNPDAPIGHHWQDATHITYGVVTAGFSFGKAKIEASSFNGTEPNENRWNFDRPRLNSFSGRFSVNPTKNWSLQVSHAYLRNPEPLEPEIRILRKTSASAIYNKKIDDRRNWSSAFVWGQNHANGERSNSFLYESNYDFAKNAVFGRFETVKKSGHDLVLEEPLDHGQFWVQAASIGYIRDIVKDEGIDVGLGGMATFNHNPAALASLYGGTSHAGWQFFVRLRPSRIQ